MVCKVPTEDPDAVKCFVSELEINLKIARLIYIYVYIYTYICVY